MNRRDVIKGVFGLSIASLLPKSLLALKRAELNNTSIDFNPVNRWRFKELNKHDSFKNIILYNKDNVDFLYPRSLSLFLIEVNKSTHKYEGILSNNAFIKIQNLDVCEKMPIKNETDLLTHLSHSYKSMAMQDWYKILKTETWDGNIMELYSIHGHQMNIQGKKIISFTSFVKY